ncbi:MAG: hypothetical protein AAF828_00055 [Bacteroidota bacterium]
MNKLFIWLVGRFNFLWARLGADPKAISLILNAKLKMDDRVGYVMGRQSANRKTDMQYLVFGLALLIGGVFIMPLISLPHQATAIGLMFSFWMLYIGFLLITEMSESLFDTRDLYILLSRPLTDTTLSLSRMLHIGVFTGKFTLALGFAPGIYILFWLGPWPFVVYFFLSMLTVVITMTATLALYLIVLRRVSPERVRKIMGYFQIIATIFFLLLYQLPNLISISGSELGLDELTVVGEPYGYLFAGFWLGGIWDVVVNFQFNIHSVLQAILGVGGALAGLVFYVRQSKDYGQKMLSMRQAGSQDATAQDRAIKTGAKSPVRDFLGPLLTRDGLERASFNFHWNMMLRDFGFKQRTYPSIVFMPMIAIGLVVKNLTDEVASENPAASLAMDDSWAALILLYAMIFTLITPLVQTKMSKQYEASWIFFANPLRRKGELRYGQLMSVWGMFFIPVALLLYPFVLIVWGIDLLPDILIACGSTLALSMIFHSMDKALPFSQEQQSGSGESLGPTLITMFLVPVFGFGHYFLAKVPYLILLGIAFIWIVVFYSLRELRKET